MMKVSLPMKEVAAARSSKGYLQRGSPLVSIRRVDAVGGREIGTVRPVRCPHLPAPCGVLYQRLGLCS